MKVILALINTLSLGVSIEIKTSLLGILTLEKGIPFPTFDFDNYYYH